MICHVKPDLIYKCDLDKLKFQNCCKRGDRCANVANMIDENKFQIYRSVFNVIKTASLTTEVMDIATIVAITRTKVMKKFFIQMI